MENKSEESAVKGMFWKTLEQYSILGIQFILQIIIARLLEPSAFGIIAIVIVFITISNVFIQNGFAVALVQRKEIDREDVSSVFHFSMIVATLFYVIMFCSSGFISSFFSMPELDPLLKVMALSLFPQTYCSIQTALLRRQMDFKSIFKTSIIAVSISGAIAIVAAYQGLGVWALAMQQMIYCFALAFALYFHTKWVPLLVFKAQRLKEYFSFGWKVLVTNLVDEAFNELRSIVIGRCYSSADLSFFNRGKQFPNLLMKSINGSLQAVLLPKLSKNQDNRAKLFDIMHQTISVSSFVMFPLMTLLAISATPMVEWMLTEKWLPCVLFIQWHCLYYATWPVTTTNAQALYAIGRSDVVMKAELIRKVLDIAVLFVTLTYGVIGITIGSVVVSLLTVPIYLLPAQRCIGYKIIWQFKDMNVSLLLSIMMGGTVYCLRFLHWGAVTTFCFQIVFGIFLYVSMAYLFKVKALDAVCSIFKLRLRK